VQVNSVSPGFAQSAMTGAFYANKDVYDLVANAHPTGEWVDPSDVASAVVFLLNAPAGVRGSDLFVDNGVAATSIPDYKDTAAIKRIAPDEPCCGREK
jgi:NAD(P)-dependent dehydrogenase (short-subunit alcohol dehydrogenase family)